MRTRDDLRPGRIAVAKIPGGENAADFLAEHLDWPAITRRMERLGRSVESGLYNSAPTAAGGGVKEGDGKLLELD